MSTLFSIAAVLNRYLGAIVTAPARIARPAPRSLVLTAAVTAAAALVITVTAPSFRAVDAVVLSLMLGLVLLSEIGVLELFDRGTFSVSTAPIVAAILLLGGPGVVVAPVSVFVRGVRRGSSWYKVLFNVSTQLLAGAAASEAVHLSGIPTDDRNLILVLVPAGLAGGIYYIVNTALTACAMATDLRLRPVQVWLDNFRWLWPQYLGLSLMGLLLAVASRDYGVVGAAGFILPPLMLRYVAKQYLDRTHENVRQLRELNQDLAEEIRRREHSEMTLQHLALHDGLTSLPNRSLLADRVQQALASCRRDRRPLALLLMDLDRFKEVNDTFGHHQGDLLLQEIGRRLRAGLREADTVARLGGDEFAVLLPLTDAHGASETARTLLEMLGAPIDLEDRAFEVSASIGIAVFPDHGDDSATLLRRADVAMYAAKRAGTGAAVYSPDQDQNSPDRVALVGALRRAIEQDELALHFQPKLDLRSGRVVGAEALVRWQHAQRGLVAPDEFIGTAEETGLIRPLSLWVLDAALRQCRAWHQAGHSLSVSVNLSVRNLHDEDLADVVSERLAAWGVRPEALVIEITETTLMADPDRALRIIRRLHNLGVRIAIDDFGTGFSSLSYLNRLPVSELKIDQSFVRHMVSARNEATIVRSTIGLAHELGLLVVAEGIEDRATLELLADLGCDVGQGYFVSRPQPASDFTAWLEQAREQHELPRAA